MALRDVTIFEPPSKALKAAGDQGQDGQEDKEDPVEDAEAGGVGRHLVALSGFAGVGTVTFLKECN